MSFTIYLAKNVSEDNKLTKSIYSLGSFTGALRDTSSIINPRILLEGDVDDFVEANYLYIPQFSRYYFINDIVSVREGLVEVTAHVDVLTSFATEIRANTAIVYKQENKWNLYLDDGSFKMYQNPHIITKEFPGGFTGQDFVLAVAGS